MEISQLKEVEGKAVGEKVFEGWVNDELNRLFIHKNITINNELD